MWLDNNTRGTKNEKASLATKFALICSKKSCSFYTSPPYLHTTPKQEQSYDVKKKSVLASRLINKGRCGLSKLCGVLGLTSPISKKAFTMITKFWKKITCDLIEKSFQNAVEKVMSMRKECDVATSDTFNVATSFDGSWSSRRWTANKGIIDYRRRDLSSFGRHV